MEKFFKVLEEEGCSNRPPTYILNCFEQDDEKIMGMSEPFVFYKVKPGLFYTYSTYTRTNIACFVWQALGHNNFCLSDNQSPQFAISEKQKLWQIKLVMENMNK